MSEEKQEEGFFSQIKNQIIAGVGITLTAVGTMFVDTVKEFVGIEDDEPTQTEQVISPGEQNQSVNVSGPVINLTIPEQKPSTTTIIREVPAEPAKKDTVVVEPPPPPSAKDRLLNRRKSDN